MRVKVMIDYDGQDEDPVFQSVDLIFDVKPGEIQQSVREMFHVLEAAFGVAVLDDA